MNERKRIERRLRLKQRLMGLVLLIICVCIVMMTSTGTTMEERDLSPVLLFGPWGLWMLLTKKIIVI